MNPESTTKSTIMPVRYSWDFVKKTNHTINKGFIILLHLMYKKIWNNNSTQNLATHQSQLGYYLLIRFSLI